MTQPLRPMFPTLIRFSHITIPGPWDSERIVWNRLPTLSFAVCTLTGLKLKNAVGSAILRSLP